MVISLRVHELLIGIECIRNFFYLSMRYSWKKKRVSGFCPWEKPLS